MLRAVPLAVTLIALLAGQAQAARVPTPAERGLILADVRHDMRSPLYSSQKVPDGCWRVLVSTVNRNYARVDVPTTRSCRLTPPSEWLIEHRFGEWRTDYLGRIPLCWRKQVGLVKPVLRDLFGDASCR
jgi:hypothetical protein